VRGDRERLDVEGAVGFVDGEPDVEPGRIGTVGFSMGALAVAMEAIGDARVRAIVFEAGHPGLEELVRLNFGSRGLLSQLPAVAAARILGLRLAETRPVDRLCELRPRPVLLIYGGRDEIAPPTIGPRMLAASCGTARLWIVTGGRHGDWDKVSPQELEARLTAFFEEALPSAGGESWASRRAGGVGGRHGEGSASVLR
jgi:pimeloyl-ACP methyl ester carboxylesterase